MTAPFFTGRIFFRRSGPDGGRFAGACGEDALQLITVQPEGKPRMSAHDWLRGARLQPGDHLG